MRDAVRAALATEEELTLLTRGRRSGRMHEVRLWFGFDGDDVWLRTDQAADWYRNLLKDPRCRVRVGSLEVDAELVPVPDTDAALRSLVALWRAKYGVEWVADWYVERGRVPIRIHVTDRGGAG